MAGVHTRIDEPVSGINITPFVDVVLVLLVALMVTATDLAAQAIGVDLPHAATAAELPPRTLAVTLDAEGRLLLDGESRSEDEFRARVRVAHAADAEVRAIVTADARATHGRVVHIVDLLRREGVTRFALEVRPEG